jgi:deoxyribonuclease V
MRLAVRHRWDLTPKEAAALQRKLAPRVVAHDDLPVVERVAGVDVGIGTDGERARAAVVVLALRTLAIREHALARRALEFPYVPGLLSFRELPVVLDALAGLSKLPDLILCDGQGYAHPRRFGLACHLGVTTGIPTIGVGKTRLLGEYDSVPDRRGAWVPLRDGEDVIGAVLRTRPGVKPVFVSVGHRVGLDTAVRLVMECTRKYKLPETTRQAHHFASVADSP